MGQKKTFYFSDEDMVIHDKAKKYAKELSPIVVKGLRAFVEAKEREELGMKEFVLFIGKKQDQDRISDGKMVKFTAKELATDLEEHEGKDTYHKTYRTLYYTRKGKYLVLERYETLYETATSYEQYETVQELLSEELPSLLMDAAVANNPEIAIEELDV